MGREARFLRAFQSVKCIFTRITEYSTLFFRFCGHLSAFERNSSLNVIFSGLQILTFCLLTNSFRKSRRPSWQRSGFSLDSQLINTLLLYLLLPRSTVLEPQSNLAPACTTKTKDLDTRGSRHVSSHPFPMSIQQGGRPSFRLDRDLPHVPCCSITLKPYVEFVSDSAS